MRVRSGYLLAGVAWALLLGPLAAYFVGATAAIVLKLLSWNEPVSAAADAIVVGLALFAGLAVGLPAILILHRHGRDRDRAALSASRREWRRVIALILTPVGIVALIGGVLLSRAQQQTRALETLAGQEEAFARFAAASHRISGLAVTTDARGDLRAEVAILGRGAGLHVLSWRVEARSGGTVLSGGKPSLHLDPGQETIVILVALDAIAEGYRDKVLGGGGRGGVFVDEMFDFAVRIEPVAPAEEMARWSASRRDQFEVGPSPLRSEAVAAFPVRFRIDADGTLLPGPPPAGPSRTPERGPRLVPGRRAVQRRPALHQA